MGYIVNVLNSQREAGHLGNLLGSNSESGRLVMGDVTKKEFLEMLECVDDPVVEIRDRAKYGRHGVYCSDVLLLFSGSVDAGLERMRARGIAPSIAVSSARTGVVLGSCRGNRYGMGDGGRKRIDDKAVKYVRWLGDWEFAGK